MLILCTITIPSTLNSYLNLGLRQPSLDWFSIQIPGDESNSSPTQNWSGLHGPVRTCTAYYCFCLDEQEKRSAWFYFLFSWVFCCFLTLVVTTTSAVTLTWWRSTKQSVSTSGDTAVCRHCHNSKTNFCKKLEQSSEKLNPFLQAKHGKPSNCLI